MHQNCQVQPPARSRLRTVRNPIRELEKALVRKRLSADGIDNVMISAIMKIGINNVENSEIVEIGINNVMISAIMNIGNNNVENSETVEIGISNVMNSGNVNIGVNNDTNS